MKTRSTQPGRSEHARAVTNERPVPGIGAHTPGVECNTPETRREIGYTPGGLGDEIEENQRSRRFSLGNTSHMY